jgi:hypothetical protein
LAIKRHLDKDERPLRAAFEELVRVLNPDSVAIDQRGLFRMCPDHPEMFSRRKEV